jgi:hypothetical protein
MLSRTSGISEVITRPTRYLLPQEVDSFVLILFETIWNYPNISTFCLAVGAMSILCIERMVMWSILEKGALQYYTNHVVPPRELQEKSWVKFCQYQEPERNVLFYLCPLIPSISITPHFVK